MRFFLLPLVLLSLGSSPIMARVVTYNLTISENKSNPAGKQISVLTINDSSPGPVLRFHEGDRAVVHVHNHLRNEETSIHWHGLLIPNNQDGVPYLTTPPILAGQSFTFRFPIKNVGTFWYHSHTKLQEQRGSYGAVVVEPRDEIKQRDHVIVFSDWINESPNEVMRTLMRGSEFYGMKKGSMPSINGAIKAGAFADYMQREKARLPAMDISDIAYDAFLANGKRDHYISAKPGETIRLRLVNAAASTNFFLESSTDLLTVIASDGPALQPFKVKRLFFAIAETYEILITIPKTGGSYELRATAQDGSGYSSTFIGSGLKHFAPNVPKPDIYRMDDELLQSIDDSKSNATINPRPLPPYERMRALKLTNFSLDKPRRNLTFHLTGDMNRYFWSLNGKSINEDTKVLIKHGEIVRIELINDTMMHHPMHLHGHFFRVINQQGNYAPLKNVVNIPPMSRRTIEFDASESGDWLFHCHMLYHMMNGMSRVFSYEEQGEKHQPQLGPEIDIPWYFTVDGAIQSNISHGMAMLMHNRDNLAFSWMLGTQHDHMVHQDDGSFLDGYEYEADLTYDRYLNPNLSAFIGYRLTNTTDEEDRGFTGVAYRLSYLIDSKFSMDTEGDARINLMKKFQLTSRLMLMIGGQYDTESQWEYSVGMDYMLTKQLSLTTSYHSDHGLGAGFGFIF
jgi:FtsP/CotA-like multicopper oxidase with cupredoxin domain